MRPELTPELQVTLEGETLLLRPLRPDDREALYRAAADPLIWEQHPDPNRYQRAAFGKYFAGALDSRGALAVIDKSTGEIIGSSRYYQWDPDKKQIFIGFTFITRPYWGGPANREMKRLMLAHAFRFADEVWFHVGKTNWRSRRAMEKIGGVYSHEATVEVAGNVQDYVFYKILPGTYVD